MKLFLASLFSIVVGSAHAQIEIIPYDSDWPWMLLLRKTAGNIDFFQIHDNNWSPSLEMHANEVTPTQFALTYNQLKDALITPWKYSKIQIYHTGGHITSVTLVPN